MFYLLKNLQFNRRSWEQQRLEKDKLLFSPLTREMKAL
ncbi:hypothetical protein NEOC65_000983 [Neochlamydia sp. AcF65]|nr:hypothetical protein [Neochlamydia sp. AcF65]MBS4170552.1 hypothetical protein [Neochlamydia sp. AcF95]